MTLNVRGLQEDHKVKALKQTMHDLGADVAIITGTHLSKPETKKLKLPGYTIEAESCRLDSAYGGVFIAIKETTHFTAVKSTVALRQQANACTLFTVAIRRGN